MDWFRDRWLLEQYKAFPVKVKTSSGSMDLSSSGAQMGAAVDPDGSAQIKKNSIYKSLSGKVIFYRNIEGERQHAKQWSGFVFPKQFESDAPAAIAQANKGKIIISFGPNSTGVAPNFKPEYRTGLVANLELNLANRKRDLLAAHNVLLAEFTSKDYQQNKASFISRMNSLLDKICLIKGGDYLISEIKSKGNPVTFNFKKISLSKDKYVFGIQKAQSSPAFDNEMYLAFSNLSAMKAELDPLKISGRDKLFTTFTKIGLVAGSLFVGGAAIGAIGGALGSTTVTGIGTGLAQASGVANIGGIAVASGKELITDKVSAAVESGISNVTTQKITGGVNDVVKNAAGSAVAGIAPPPTAVTDLTAQKNNASAQVQQAGFGLGASGILMLLLILTIRKPPL